MAETIRTSLTSRQATTLLIGDVSYPVMQAETYFALNEIPRGRCTVGVGYNLRTGEKSAFHTDSLRDMVPASIQILPEGQFSARDAWPAASPVTIFEGYYTGMSPQTRRGQMHVTVDLVHWLIDLAASSPMSNITHPASANAMTFPIAVAPSAGLPEDHKFFLPRIRNVTVEADEAATDLWGAIRDMLSALASQDSYDWAHTSTGDLKAADAIPLPNGQAREALARITTPNNEKIGIATQFAGIHNAVASAINSLPLQQLWATNFWNLLIGRLLPEFGLALCPRVKDALVIPDLPGYRVKSPAVSGYAAPWRVIGASEYHTASASTTLARPLRATAVIVTSSSGTLASDGTPSASPVREAPATAAGAPPRPFFGGIYASPREEAKRGLLLTLAPPSWLQRVALAGSYFQHSHVEPITTATSAPDEPPASARQTVTQREAAVSASELAVRYAHLQYVKYSLVGRTGTVAGKLRFDIAPGSHIKVLSASPLEADALSPALYGMVVRVVNVLDAEGKQVSTVLNLTHLRTEAENELEDFSVANHPLLNTVMVGAPLIEELTVA